MMGNMDKASVHDGELLETGEDSAETLESAKLALNLITLLVIILAVVLGSKSV